VERLRSIGLNMGSAMEVKDEIDALALAAAALPVPPAVQSHSAAAAAGGGGVAKASRSLASSRFKLQYKGAVAPQSHPRLFASLEDFLADYCRHYGCDPLSGDRVAAPAGPLRCMAPPATRV
jgi:hypothetical protein